MLTLKPLSIDWSVAGARVPAVTFIVQTGIATQELAHVLDSLVRVSRRAEWNRVVTKQHAREYEQTCSPTQRQATMHQLFSPRVKQR